eukprot:GEMP01001836.1.p1 GENE.GEMP01001836.1~~GEMP01001836.1.p1  ORF type:complete len:1584 (+),score=273.05 GEMP01001836.1:164-4915(+)
MGAACVRVRACAWSRMLSVWLVAVTVTPLWADVNKRFPPWDIVDPNGTDYWALPQKSRPVLHLGIVGPLTGDKCFVAEYLAMRLATKHINEGTSDFCPAIANNLNGANFTVTYDLLDDGGTATGASSASLALTWKNEGLKKRKNSDRGGREADIIVGPIFSHAARSVAQVLGSLGIPVVSPGATNADFSCKSEFPYFFRTMPSDALVIKALAGIIEGRLKYNKVAVIVSRTDVTQGQSSSFADEAVVHRIRIVQSFMIPAKNKMGNIANTESALEAAFTRIIEMKYFVIVLFCNTDDCDLFLNAANKTGIFDDGRYLLLGVDVLHATVLERVFDNSQAYSHLYDGILTVFGNANENVHYDKFVNMWNEYWNVSDATLMELLPEFYSDHFKVCLTEQNISASPVACYNTTNFEGGEDLRKYIADSIHICSVYIPYAYDAIVASALGYHGATQFNDAEADTLGARMFVAAIGENFECVSGAVSFTELGDRVMSVELQRYNGSSQRFDHVVKWERNASEPDSHLNIISELSDEQFQRFPEGFFCNPDRQNTPGNQGARCLPCAPGEQFVRKTNICCSCPPAYYQNVSNEVECKVCEPGTYSSSEGSTMCTPCPLHSITTKSLRTDISDCECPEDHYWYNSSQLSEGCVRCPVHSTTAPDITNAKSRADCKCDKYYAENSIGHCILSLQIFVETFFFESGEKWYIHIIVCCVLLIIYLLFNMSFTREQRTYADKRWFKVPIVKLPEALRRIIEARTPVPCELCGRPHRNNVGVSSGFCSKSHKTAWMEKHLRSVQDRCRPNVRTRGHMMFLVGVVNVVVSVIACFYAMHVATRYFGTAGQEPPDGISNGLFLFMLIVLLAIFSAAKIILRVIAKTLCPRLHANNLLRTSVILQVEADFVIQYVPGFSFDKFKETIAQKRDDMIVEYDMAWDEILAGEGWNISDLKDAFEQTLHYWRHDRVSNDYVMRDADLNKLLHLLMSPHESQTRQSKYKTRIFQAGQREDELYTHANCTLLLLIEVLQAVCHYINDDQWSESWQPTREPTSPGAVPVSSHSGKKKRTREAQYSVDIKMPLRLRKKTAEDDSVKGTDCLHTGDFGRILDICRGAICCYSLDSLRRALEFFTRCNGEEFRAGGMTGKAHLIRCKDRLLHDSLDGCRVITINVLFVIQFDESSLPDSRIFKYHVVEIQLHHAEILARKTKGGGHVVYKWLRRQLHNKDRYYLLVDKKRGKRLGPTLQPTVESDNESEDSEKLNHPQFARMPSWHSSFSILDTLTHPKAQTVHRPTGVYKLILDLRELQRLESSVQGLIISSDGGVYEGGLLRGLRHGEGVFSFPNGDLLETTWQDDLPCGIGHYNWADGSDLVGRWRNGMPYGKLCFHVMCEPKKQYVKYHRGRQIIGWAAVYRQFFVFVFYVLKLFLWSFMGIPRAKDIQNIVLQPPPHFLSAQQKSNLYHQRTQKIRQDTPRRRISDGDAIEITFLAMERLHSKVARAVSNRTPGDSRPKSGRKSRGEKPEKEAASAATQDIDERDALAHAEGANRDLETAMRDERLVGEVASSSGIYRGPLPLEHANPIVYLEEEYEFGAEMSL